MKRTFLAAAAALLGSSVMGCGPKGYKDVGVAEFESIAGKAQVVDVRTPGEYSEGHLGGAVNIDWLAGGFGERAAKELDKSKPVAIYCRSGKRGGQAAQKLAEEGYEVVNLEGGIMAWESAGKAVER